MQRVLVADDQLPNSRLVSDQAIRNRYTKLYNDTEFAEGFVFLRKVVTLLKARGYSVDSASTPDQLRALVKNNAYDVVVMDLCWFTAEKASPSDRQVLGWQLAEEIGLNSSAQIIMFSHKFYDDPDLATVAADKGCLPVYKSYDEACARNLLVTVRWATRQKATQGASNDEARLSAQKERDFALRMYRWLSYVLLASVASGLLLLLVTLALVVMNQTTSVIATSILGAFATFVNAIVYTAIGYYKRSLGSQTQPAPAPSDPARPATTPIS
jgi:CheY-like chemotaxis protein